MLPRELEEPAHEPPLLAPENPPPPYEGRVAGDGRPPPP
jgi:hypothetical protein